MSLSAGRRTWEEASSPAAVRLAREFEQAWQDSSRQRRRPDPCDFHGSSGDDADAPGTRLALLRADMALRREAGEPVGAQWYLDRYSELGEDTVVALIYEEFCLSEEEEVKPKPAEFLERFPEFEKPLRRVLEIHQLVSSERSHSFRASLMDTAAHAAPPEDHFPEAGQTISGFHLVQELGRGSFARVFLAKEIELAGRPVAIKVTRRGSREPQTLARLQHTHIVPVYSHQIDQASGLHLLCMPYFGPITLARILADTTVKRSREGTQLVDALDRLAPAESVPQGRSAGRSALARRSYPLAIAWWGARLAEALDHAHDRGVLHRDIKPSNVLVTADGMPMLLDFNLAHEPVSGDASSGDTLGGTLDYMSPEHLRALAENSPGHVDQRSDIYSLGIVIHEAVIGRRPFGSPTRGASLGEALLRAADERLLGPPRLRLEHPEVPPALEAVIQRCLEPDPLARYQSAAQLSIDLQAVADDLPLVHAHEAWPDRLAAWVRRGRRKLAAAAAIVLALTVISVGVLGFLIVSTEPKRLRKQDFDKGVAAETAGDYDSARQFFESAADQNRSIENYWLMFNNWRTVAGAVSSAFEKLSNLRVYDPFDIQKVAAEKAQLARRTAETRHDAQAVFNAADDLRFRFLLNSGTKDLAPATVELKRVLEPFYVFKNPDWTKLEYILKLLTPEQSNRLILQVNELLFLWLCTIDDSVSLDLDNPAPASREHARTVLEAALDECDHAIVYAEPKPPWLALRARLAGRLPKTKGGRSPDSVSITTKRPVDGEPRNVDDVSSALACFQWSLLHCRGDQDLPRAMLWMQHGVSIQSNDYWYNFYLAYLEDKAGARDAALKDYSIAIALKPRSPWVRFDRAKLYRSRGLYALAIYDMQIAADHFEEDHRPEVQQAYLELGYIYQLLGNFERALGYYHQVTDAGSYGSAARLNIANIAAESGATGRAEAEFNSLLMHEPGDFAARHSRAVLELRLGQAAAAESDLTTLVDHGLGRLDRDDVLAERALARLSLGKYPEAVADSTEAWLLNPSPAHDRLKQRALLAARRYDLLQLERPDEIAYFPLAGARLQKELQAAATDLVRPSRLNSAAAYRCSLNLAIILAVLGRHVEADDWATRAIRMSPYAQAAYLVRGRVRFFHNELREAFADVTMGLAIQPDEPDLLALRGRIYFAANNPERALVDFDQAIALGTHDAVHSYKAQALCHLNRNLEALNQWSLALRRDPELPEAFVGRARTSIALARWDDALVDLEQAASWGHADPKTELAIVWSYLICLPARPKQFNRWFGLVKRVSQHLAASRPMITRATNRSSGAIVTPAAGNSRQG